MIIEVLHWLATLFIGLYAGSLLTEAVILVPYWRRMNAADFLRLHGTMGPSLFRYFAPLTTITVVLSVLQGLVGNKWQIATAILCTMAFMTFFIYFKKANESFASKKLEHSVLAAELSRWAKWHWLRTVIVVVALATSIIALV